MDEQIEVDMASCPEAAALGITRRPATTVLTLVLVCALIVGGGTALVVGLTRGPNGHSRVPAAGEIASRVVACPPSAAQTDAPPSQRVGAWPFRVLVKGTFASVVAGTAGTLYAIEACGADESDLRVVRLQSGQPDPDRASLLVHAALLTSSLVEYDGRLYFGAARLDLAGPTSSPPYSLTLYRLDPATMSFTGWRTLGRGYGMTLQATSSGVVADTGSTLLAIGSSSLAPRRLLGFGPSVAQHVVADSAGDYAVSMFTPAAVGPLEDARIEVVGGRDGRVLATVSLPEGSDPESLAVAGGKLWAAVGDGLLTTVRVFRLPALSAAGGGRRQTGEVAQSAPENLALDATGAIVWTVGLSLLECSAAATGKVLEATNQYGPAPVFLTQIVESGAALYAVSSAGIGRLAAPAACSA